MDVPVRNIAGEVVGSVAVLDTVFGANINGPLIHQAAVRYEANQRLGTRDTKTRGEVAGGGKKPYRQKGTGRARQGSIRAPHFRGGGVVFGPHPRDFSKRMPQPMRRAALRSALSGKLADGELIVVQDLAIEEAKTRVMVQTLKALGIERTTVICTGQTEMMVVRASRNIPGARTTTSAVLNIGDVLKFRTLLLTVEAIRGIEARLSPDGEQVENPEVQLTEPAAKPARKPRIAKDTAEDSSAVEAPKAKATPVMDAPKAKATSKAVAKDASVDEEPTPAAQLAAHDADAPADDAGEAPKRRTRKKADAEGGE